MALSNEQIGALALGDPLRGPDGRRWEVSSPSTGRLDLETGTVRHEAVLTRTSAWRHPVTGRAREGRLVHLLNQGSAHGWAPVPADGSEPEPEAPEL